MTPFGGVSDSTFPCRFRSFRPGFPIWRQPESVRAENAMSLSRASIGSSENRSVDRTPGRRLRAESPGRPSSDKTCGRVGQAAARQHPHRGGACRPWAKAIRKSHRNPGGFDMRTPKRLLLRLPSPPPPADGEGEGSHGQHHHGARLGCDHEGQVHALAWPL